MAPSLSRPPAAARAAARRCPGGRPTATSGMTAKPATRPAPGWRSGTLRSARGSSSRITARPRCWAPPPAASTCPSPASVAPPRMFTASPPMPGRPTAPRRSSSRCTSADGANHDHEENFSVPGVDAAAEHGRGRHRRTDDVVGTAGACGHFVPNHPLLTGGNALPPNILMILDDSGSMDRSWMWADKDTSSGTSDTVTDRSYVNNSLYYNPATIYRPWRTYSTDLNVRLPPADFRSVSNSTTSPTADKIDLTDSWHERRTYFYLPKVANPGTTTSNYDKYRITSSTSATSYNGGVVQKLIGSTTIASGTIPSISGGEDRKSTRLNSSH